MYLIWSASLNPAWPSDQHVGLSAILGSRLSSRDFFLKILSLLVRAWEEGERLEWGGGGGGWGEVQLGRMVSTSHLLSTRAVPASSPSPTTSWTCLFCRPKLNPRPRLQITNLFSPASGVPVMGSIGLFSSIHLSGVPAGQLER